MKFPTGHITARCVIRSLPHRGQWTTTPSGNASRLNTLSNSMKLRGCFLLDHEALACLLVLLFVDEPQLNTVRLHRVLRNLCHHRPTRNWLVKVCEKTLNILVDCKLDICYLKIIRL